MQQETIDLDNENQLPDKLPTFLKVLCILTFVGGGLGVFSSIWTITPTAIQMNYNAMSLQDLGPFGTFDIPFDEYASWVKYSGYAGIGGSILALLGALLMWKRKKVGFYLYVPSWVLPTVIGFMSLSHLMPESMIGIGMITQIVMTMIGIGFIIMYAVNLKHMR